MKYISPTIKGVVISIVLILISIISFYVFHFKENGDSQYVVLCTYIAGLLWAIFSARKNEHTSSLKDYFTVGFKAFIVVALFMSVYTYFFYHANPQIMENGILENNVLIQKEGNHTKAEIEDNANKLRSVFMPMMLSLNVIKFLFLGALVSLVSGGFLSQKNN